MNLNPVILTILIVVNIPLYYFSWKWIFKCWEGFWECVRFWLTPDIVSMFRGEYGQDWFSELKLGWWIFLCVAAVAIEYAAIHHFFLR